MRNKYPSAMGLILVTVLTIFSFSSVYAQAVDNDENAGEDVALEEVIVTATKRAERLIDVPISMSVVTADDMNQLGIRELREAANHIPNVQISQNNDYGSTVTIRGVGANSRNIGFDTRVGVYVDGIYMGQSPALNQELLDLQQVEVLRGPQGTLFGKDTVAGAVNMITRKPSDEFEGEVTADVGSMGYTQFKGIVNVPLSDTVSVKGAVSKADRDGYILNTGTGNELATIDKLAYRVQLRFEPSEKFAANFSFDGLSADSLTMNGEPVTDMLGLFPLPENREVDYDFDPYEHRDIKGVTLNLDYLMDGGFALKSLTGWRDTNAFYSNATDYSPTSVVFIEYEDDYEQFSQEFQLISPDDQALTYVAGLYLYSQQSDTNRDVVFGDRFNEDFIGFIVGAPPGTPDAVLAPIAAFLGFGPEGSTVTNYGSVKTKNYAAYFNAGYDLSEKFTLGVGARYSIVDKDADWILDGRNSGFFGIGSTNVPVGGSETPTPLVIDRSDTAFTYLLSLSYALSDTSNVYIKTATGFKSGGFNLDYINAVELAYNPDLEFDDETADSYELGIKADLGPLSFSAAAFLMNFDDYQVNQFIVLDPNSSPPLTSIRITNAASVETKGVELEVLYQATDNLQFRGSVGYLDATFDSFPGGATGGGDASGKTLPGAPDFSAYFGAQYYHDMPALNATLLVRGDVTYRSGMYQTIDNTKTAGYGAVPGTFDFGYVDELTLLNGRIGYIHNNGNLEVYLWGHNLTDEKQSIQDIQDFFGTKVRYPSIGRTWGVKAVWNF